MGHPTSAQAQYGTSSTSISFPPTHQESTLPFTGVNLIVVLILALVITAAGAALLAFLKERQ